ncbi:response regulator [Emcibacter sp. SYSU 3D8]|uniref:response regulator n=1 Tax=Emcibacter sp. SYSU 3D8 TaxID=3133969 RepID=UPI0031FEC6ED
MVKKEQFRLLLVEDNPGDADLAAERLSEMPDHDITVVDRLTRAIEVLEETRIDAVILDLNLPDSTGIETFRQLRRVSESVAIVVYSGDNDPKLRLQALAEGALDYVEKNAPSYGVQVRGLLYSIERYKAQTTQRQIESIISANPDAVIVTDTEQLVQFANNAALELFGKTEDELIGKSLDFPLRQDEVTEIEVVRLGAKRRAEVRVARIDWQARPALLASIRDMTDRRLMEEKLFQSQKMEAVGQLTGGVAHDINNLLQVIIGNAEVLIGHETDEEVRNNARYILLAAERGAELTRRLLIFARRQTLSTKPVDVGQLLRRIEGLARRTLGENIEVSTTIEPNLPMATADEAQLESGILNLCLNARDAMPEGGHLTIDARSESVATAHGDGNGDNLTPGQYVCISVADTGTGMPPDVVQRAFEPFFTTKSQGKGTGLGLSMIYGLMKQLGGGARIASTVNQGTTLTLHLPAAIQREVAAEPERVRPKFRGGSERILFVEDNDLVRSSVEALLKRLGYKVVPVVDAHEALETLNHDHAFDLLFTDMVLPGGLNGRKLANEVKERWPEIQVLFSSGYTDLEALQVDVGEEPLDLLPKPYRQEELAERIRTILDRKAGKAR